jgi:hypothetical protein
VKKSGTASREQPSTDYIALLLEKIQAHPLDEISSKKKDAQSQHNCSRPWTNQVGCACASARSKMPASTEELRSKFLRLETNA